MAVTRQELLDMLYPAAAISNSPASLSIKDFAKQTGLNQTLSDYQDAYADAVLSGSKAGKEILAQGDKAFSSQWYEILQNALRAALASRATGGELGTDFTEALSTTLAAMQEAGAGATAQQNAYVNLANQIATAMAEAGVNGMSAFQQQGANLAQSYPALMEALAMQDSNLLAQLLGLLNDPAQGTVYNSGYSAVGSALGGQPGTAGQAPAKTLGATVLQPLNPGVAGPVQVTQGNPYNLGNQSVQPDRTVLAQLAQDAFRNQIAAEDGLAWLDRMSAAGQAEKQAAAAQAVQQQSDIDALARMYEDQLLSKDYRKAQVEQAKAAQNAAYAARPNMQPQSNADWAQFLKDRQLDNYSPYLNNMGSSAPNAQRVNPVTGLAETEEERNKRITKLFTGRNLSAQIAAARSNAAKQAAAQQATQIAQAAQSTGKASVGPKAVSISDIAAALKTSPTINGTTTNKSGGSSSGSSRTSKTSKTSKTSNYGVTVTQKLPTGTSGPTQVISGNPYSLPKNKITVGGTTNSGGNIAGYSAKDIANRKKWASQGEME